MAYKDLTPRERITAVCFDIMKDVEFSLMGGATQIGKMTVEEDVPTACTNGVDTRFGRAFIMGMTRQQLTYLVAHETLHKMLMHCVEYGAIVEKYPRESNQAMDYVVNQMIEDLDGGRGFVERPTDPAPLIDAKYKGMSFLEVLQDLLRNPPQQQQSDGKPQAGTMDEHQQTKAGAGDPRENILSEEEMADLKKDMQDAVAQGQIVREKMQAKKRGDSGSGGRVSGFEQRTTDWKGPLRRFIAEQAEGDEFSRFSPPNKRFLPLSVVMPSHYSETVGEIIIAADTSGSMHPYYGVIFGEIARLCQQTHPAKVRVLWWDTKIAGEDVYTEKDYAQIAKLMKPVGGGGTTVSCVADHIAEKKIKARCVIYLSDGYVESQYRVPSLPCLWAIVDNEAWRPLKGQKLNISSTSL